MFFRWRESLNESFFEALINQEVSVTCGEKARVGYTGALVGLVFLLLDGGKK